MKRIIILIFLLFTLNSVFSETIRIGYYQFEPYIIFQGKDKSPGGPIGEYWQSYLIPGMKVTVEWIGPLPLLRLLKYFEEGKLDAILLFPRENELEKKYLYPRTPFMTGRPGISLRKDNALDEISGKESLYNLKISYIKGGFLPSFLQSASIQIDYTTKEKYLAVNLEKLINKRVDAVFNLDIVTNRYEADKFGYGNQIKSLLLPVDPVEFFTVFTKTEKGQRLLQLYEPVNKKLYTEGTFNLLIDKYIPVNYRK
ncbi:MAG: transporter substrate-binding domain-containing protein [Spirochaetales bacterium]|nr:transporter substrate-binding domain-containing protein [Spirochaetales bacterium]